MFYLYWLNIDFTLANVADEQGCHVYHNNKEVAEQYAVHYLGDEAKDGYSILVLPDASLHGTHHSAIMNFKKLTIIHNHGTCVLENGTIENGVAKGICTGGGEQSRLFWATSDRRYPTGVEKEWPVGSRRLSPCYGPGGWSEADKLADEYRVDVCVF